MKNATQSLWYKLRTKIPHQSGVYFFKNKKEQVIYVGKAIDLYHRVSSYFTGAHDIKTAALIGEIKAVDTVVVESELEALILEANLIKGYLPKFNIRLTDDKDYLYIGITEEDFPKVITVRKKDLKSVKKYFGPFPSAKTVRNTLKLLRKVFPWCSSASQGDALRSKRACFYFHLGLCPGACVGLINKGAYNKILGRFSKFLEGGKEELVEELAREMQQSAKQEKFEDAAKIKKMIDGISYLTQTNRTSFYLENPNFLEDETKLALKQLQKDLNLKNLPKRIECYDVSNIQGKDATGSLVVLTNGEIDKSQYRKFKIKMSGRPNDVGMIREIIRRRLTHPEWFTPDLVLVDGGRGQARAAKLETGSWKLEIPVFGLAKRMEWLYPPAGEIIKLPKRSLSLKLLQKIRDEAHRFAVSYHRKLRDKHLLRTFV